MTPTIRRTFGAKAFGAAVAPQSLGKPAAAYPGAVATDSDMIIAVDRQQTRLALPLNATDTSMTVTDPSVIVAYCLLTIDSETVKVTGAPAGNVVPISRAFDGTTAAVHLASAAVSGFVDAYHHNRLVAEVEAIQQTLGPNLSRIPGGSSAVASASYAFAPQTPGGSLIAGNNSITLTPVPQGVNGTDKDHYLYISGGTGTAEAVLITGGAAVSGAASGTLIVNCANAHSGAWTIGTATSGAAEAQQANLQTNPFGNNYTTIILPAGTVPFHGTMTLFAGTVLRGQGIGNTFVTGDLALSPIVQTGDFTNGIIGYDCGLADLWVTRAAGTIPVNTIGVYFGAFAQAWTENLRITRNYIGAKTDNSSLGLSMQHTFIAQSSFVHLWLKDMAEFTADALRFGMNAEGTTIVPTYLVQVSGITNDVKFVNSGFFGPGGAPAQYALGFTGATGEIFLFDQCIVESVESLVFSDAATAQIRTMKWANSRLTGDAGSPQAAFVLNAATQLLTCGFNMVQVGAFSSFNLTNPNKSTITGSFLSVPQTYTGGAGGGMVYAGNTSAANVTFAGTWTDSLVVSDNAFSGGILTYTGVSGALNIGPNAGSGAITSPHVSVNTAVANHDFVLRNSSDNQSTGGAVFLNTAVSDAGTVVFQGGDHNLYLWAPASGGHNVLTNNGTMAFSLLSSGASRQLAVNYIGSTSGSTGAIGGSLADASGTAIALVAGLTVRIKLSQALNAGANTFNFNSGGNVAIKSARNPANNIAVAYAIGGTVVLQYDGTQWVDLSQ